MRNLGFNCEIIFLNLIPHESQEKYGSLGISQEVKNGGKTELLVLSMGPCYFY